MILLWAFTAAAVLLSFLFNRQKTLAALRKGGIMFAKMFLPFMGILAVISLALAFLSRETIVAWLGRESGPLGFLSAALAGSISLIPGFVAFPLAAILIRNGAGYAVAAVFITTLMMVGVLTLPLEAKYFGLRTALIRNSLSLAAALIIGLAIGFLWGLV